MPAPIGYFLTWANYGTRLHGDKRGTVDRNHNHHGEPYLPADEIKQAKRFSDLSQPPLKLDAKMRGIVEHAIRRHAEIRGWLIHALNIRTNHIHLVLCGELDPARALNEFKAYCTRALRAEKIIAADRKVWVRKGSERWLWNRCQLERACWYTLHAQGPDLPVDWRGDDEGRNDGP
jgi:REP element-mobilizing transposase RayT